MADGGRSWALRPFLLLGRLLLSTAREPPAGWRLQTTAPVAMKVHAVRLLPGDDLVQALRESAASLNLRAACVVTCVGSLSRVTLRPAGKKEPFQASGDFEILSLSGTLSQHGHHLHLGVADADCHATGGHALAGCTVRTTAEVVLGELQHTVFRREQDARTGFKELFIDRDAPAAADMPVPHQHG